jgi:hypothetical protein
MVTLEMLETLQETLDNLPVDEVIKAKLYGRIIIIKYGMDYEEMTLADLMAKLMVSGIDTDIFLSWFEGE